MSIKELTQIRDLILEELAEQDSEFFPATKDQLHRLLWIEQEIDRIARMAGSN